MQHMTAHVQLQCMSCRAFKDEYNRSEMHQAVLTAQENEQLGALSGLHADSDMSCMLVRIS